MSERTNHPLLREVASEAASEPPLPVSLAPAITPQAKDEVPPSAAAVDAAAETARYRRRVLLTLSAVVLALVLYWASGYFFAYTDDAYVTSDFVSVAPYISGRIVSINIVDNQTVRKGELLATIDPTPFQLALNEITAAGFYSRQGLDTLTAKEQEAKAALANAESAIAKAQQTLALHQATVAAIGTEISYLQWQLDQTQLLAPTDGTITQLTLRVGDQARENAPLIGLVDAHAWRI